MFTLQPFENVCLENIKKAHISIIYDYTVSWLNIQQWRDVYIYPKTEYKVAISSQRTCTSWEDVNNMINNKMQMQSYIYKIILI